MTLLEEYVDSLDYGTKCQIIMDYEVLCKYGCIGDSEIRERANHFQNVIIGCRDENIVMLMERLTFECYRDLFLKEILPKELYAGLDN